MRSRLHRVAAASAVVALLAATVVLLGWRAHGGRWVRVETPSMGTEAPVGSLLWVAPTRFTDLRAGDLITFTAPGASADAPLYSHLVAEVHEDGTLSTRGRIAPRDPWRVGPQDVVGKVVLRWPGVGWLVLAAPLLGLGGLVLAAVAIRLRDRALRGPFVLVAGSVLVALALVVHRPLTRAEQVSFVAADGGARATYVSTGLLPVRLSEPGGSAVVLGAGEVGSVLATGPEPHRFEVRLGPAIGFGWWLALVGGCFVPAASASRPRRRPRVGTNPGPT